MTFKPGQSGNPEGARIRKRGFTPELRKLAQQHTELGITALAEIVKQGLGHKPSKGIKRIKGITASSIAYCAAELFDRGWGKPAQHMTVTPKNEIHDFSDDELRVIAGEYQAIADMTDKKKRHKLLDLKPLK